MTPPVFRSTQMEPFARGREFGEVFAAQVRTTVKNYQGLFNRVALRPFDLYQLGSEAMAAIDAFASPLHQEIRGIAAGSGVAVELIGAINARTEILAYLGAQLRGECSTVVLADPWGPPVTAQTWDWYAEFGEQWLVWEIPHADGRVTTTVTEFGIVGKPGVNNRGLGLHFNILHHQHDGLHIGLPVHVLARWLLDSCSDINQALQLCRAAPVSASSVLTLVAAIEGASAAVSVELHPGGPSLVFPDARGLLIHTNHFVAQAPRTFDTEPNAFPDTLVRYDLLRRRLAGRTGLAANDLLTALHSHLGSTGALCCHPDPALPVTGQYATLACVTLDVPRGTLRALPGGPCAHL